MRAGTFLCVLAATGLASASSSAADAPATTPNVEVTSDTAAQFYEVRSPTGQTVIARRRLMVTLGAAVYNLLDKPTDPLGPSLTFRARMRYDADYGGSAEETAAGNPDRLVPGFSRGPVDLMYGYVEGRRFLGGWLGFRLGRQYVTDALGWWSFDGGLVNVTTPYYVKVEGYAGLEQRGGLPFSTPRYEREGIWRGDRTGYDPNLWPSFQPNAIAPAYGAAIETTGFQWIHGRLTYRRVYNTGGSSVTQFDSGQRSPVTYDGTRLSQERLGYAFEGTIPSVAGLKGGLAYDFYARRFGNLYASLDGYVSKRVTVSADYEYFRPTFDADSIWNFFVAMPMNDLTLRTSWDATDRLSLAGGVRGRAFTQQTGLTNQSQSPGAPNTDPNTPDPNYYPSTGIEPMGGANLSARWRMGEGMVGARGLADVARTGDRVGIDFYGERTLETRFVMNGRAGLWHWDDKLRADRDATSFGYVLGAGYKVLPRSLALAEFQHDMNRLAGHRFRVMLWLTLAFNN